MKLVRSTLLVRSTVLIATALLATTGCNRKSDYTSRDTAAINNFYSSRPSCLWNEPTNFPKQADTSGSEKTSQLDSLVDAGLLTRTTAEKKVFIVASKQVNNYDLSDKGRSAWAADPQQPGYGNFCYGHRKVTSIDNAGPIDNDAAGATATVQFHYAIANVPDWAKNGGVQTAFPQLRSDLAGQQTSTATITNTPNGLQVTSVPGSASYPGATSADGQIVK